jgi:hypothetical protein
MNAQINPARWVLERVVRRMRVSVHHAKDEQGCNALHEINGDIEREASSRNVGWTENKAEHENESKGKNCENKGDKFVKNFLKNFPDFG